MNSVKEFIKFLNSKYLNEDYQIIPAYSFKAIPKMPFVTYFETDVEIHQIAELPNRELNNGVVTTHATHYKRVVLTFKVYGNTYIDLLADINFRWKDEIIRKNYGITNLESAGYTTEKLENGQYLKYETFNLTLDFNYETTKNNDELKEIGLDGDINENIEY